MQNPLVRWTLGKVSDDGFEILLESIKYWKKIYPQFDGIVCFNNADPDHIIELTNLNVELLNQAKEYNNNIRQYIWEPISTGWKLYPPRLRKEGHEIFCDNDLILLEKCEIIDEFLNSEDMLFSTSAIRRCYGHFSKFVIEKNLRVNTGLFGVPPFFDLSQKIKSFQNISGHGRWRNFFDEQGLLASIFSREDNFKLIPMGDVYNCLNNFKLCGGVHFCGINTGYRKKSWESFKKIRILFA